MSFYETFTDWLAAKQISSEDIQTHQDVAKAQQEILDRQYAQGKRGVLDYYNLSGEVTDAGNYTQDFVDQNSSFSGVILAALAKIPFWLWLVLGGIAFWYLGGFTWLKGSLAKGKKS
jgi:hypothetical protein